MTDSTVTLPAVRVESYEPEGTLPGPRLFKRFVVWLAGWDKRREDYWNRLRYKPRHRLGLVVGATSQRPPTWAHWSTDEWPVVSGVVIEDGT